MAHTTLFAAEIIELDLVTVASQKQEENLQEVPLSVTVFNEITLEDKKIDTIKDLAPFIPNFMAYPVGGISGVINPTLRGLSTIQQSTLVRVPIIIDGVIISGIGGYDASLFDIEKIEVLRGPQSTLYGAGAEAGLISITTKKPNNKTRAKIDLEFGSDDKRQYSFYASGAVVKDKFYIGIAGLHYEKDGDIKNTVINKIVNNKENQYGKIHFRYTPTDALDISFISSLFKRDDGALNGNMAYQPKKIVSNLNGFSTENTLSNTLKIDYVFDKYKLESITTMKNLEIEFVHDFDFTPATLFHESKLINADSITQELRLSSKHRNYSWLLGLFLDNETDTYNTVVDTMTQQGLLNLVSGQEVTGKSLGVFAHFYYDLTEKFTFVSGLRYDKVDKELKEKEIYLEEKSSEISPKISLKYKIDQDIMTYATIAKGYSPGSFNTQAVKVDKQTYGAEKLVSYELGVKSSFFENRLIANTALYFIDIKTLHTVQHINVIDFYISNKAQATSKGFELELQANPTDNWSLFASYGYNDITFDSFKNAKGDYRGNTKPFAPRYTYSLATQYRNLTGYFVSANLVGYGKIYLDNANENKREAYSIVNTKIGYETESFDIYLYGKNLFDKDYSTHKFAQLYEIYSEPREIGIELAYRF